MKSVAVALALLIALPVVAGAQDFPKMRAGLWQTTSMTKSADPKPASAHVSTICIDAALQKLMIQMSQGVMLGMCSKHNLVTTANVIKGDAVCDVMGSKASTKAVMKFTGDTRYHTDAHTTYDPPLAGRTTSDTVVDGKYLGPCPAGMKPGDLTLPGGKTINLKSIIPGQ